MMLNYVKLFSIIEIKFVIVIELVFKIFDKF